MIFIKWIAVSLWIGTTISPAVFAKATKRQPTEAKCARQSLVQKNCLIKLGSGRYQFLKSNLTVNDGTWRQVVPLPIVVDDVEWQSLRVFDLGGRRFYELKLWNTPDALQIQSLHWLVVEIKGVEVQLHLDHVIQKRRIEKAEGQKTNLVLDKEEKHGLKLSKNEIQWFVGHKKGVLKNGL